MGRPIVCQTQRCMVCGESTRLTLDEDRVKRWQAGEHVQRVWPEFTPEQRELLITGTHPACWDKMFSEEER